MKKVLSLLVGVVLMNSINAQQTFTVNQGVGDTFDPAQLTVNQGDIIHFNLAPPHNVTQVSLDTWNANGTTPLPGGFSFPSGSGDYTTTAPGVIYYVCTVHVSLGMKGTITVNAVTGINDAKITGAGKIYPNPATDFLTCALNRYSMVNEIRIVNISGNTVKIIYKPEVSGDKVKIDIADLVNGMYFVLVKTDNEIISAKFLK